MPMIDLRGVWLPQILGYAELVSHERILRSSWIDGDRSETSITDFDEMIEQIFGLDCDAQVEFAEQELTDDPDMAKLLGNFIAELKIVDRFVVEGDLNDQPQRIFSSSEWARFRKCAQQLENHAAGCDYTSDLAPEPFANRKP